MAETAQAAREQARKLQGIEAYVERLGAEDRRLLDELVRAANLRTAAQFARKLVDDAIRTEKRRRAGLITRQRQRDEAYAHRWAEAISAAIAAGQKRGRFSWIRVDYPSGRVTTVSEWQASRRGVVDVLDARPAALEAMKNEAGLITPWSVFAWLTGRPKTTGVGET